MPKYIFLGLCSFFVTLLMFFQFARAEFPGEQFTHFMGFTLDSGITLKEIELKLGPVSLVETGDAGGYEAKICYRARDIYIQFCSGELGGPDHDLLGFELSLNPPQENCVSLKKENLLQDMNIGGIYLGMSKDEYLKLVMSNENRENNSLPVWIYYKRPMTKKEKESFSPPGNQDYFDVFISIAPKFSDDKLSSFYVWKTTTY